MPANRSEMGSPEDWLKRAKSNLVRAKQPKPDEAFWEDYCFKELFHWDPRGTRQMASHKEAIYFSL
jgi:hypothetical protein